MGDLREEDILAMGEEKGDSFFDLAFLVHRMNIHRLEAVSLDSGLEVWQLVQFGLLGSPAEIVLPVCRQSFHVCQWGAIIPAGLIKFVGEDGGFKLLFEESDVVLRD